MNETAALMAFPFAWLYRHVLGSTDGLFLYLRYVYLFGSVLASACVIVVLRKFGLGVCSWIDGLFIWRSIPFGLPAPSYNTIGLQALSVALGAYGIGVRTRHQRADLWFGISAVAWTIAGIAYPPLILAAAVLAVFLMFHRDDRTLSTWRYLFLLVSAQIAGWALVVAVMPVSRLLMDVRYTSATAPGGFAAKLGNGFELMAHHRWFALLCVAAIALGLARRRLPSTVATCALASLVGLSFVLPPVLLVRSHDVVTLVALTGVGLIWVSLAAGVMTMFFATNPLSNFCFGSAFAAALVVATPDGCVGTRGDLVGVVAGLCLIGAVLSTSLRLYYGDNTTPGQERRRIEAGFFAGIQAGPDDVRILEICS